MIFVEEVRDWFDVVTERTITVQHLFRSPHPAFVEADPLDGSARQMVMLSASVAWQVDEQSPDGWAQMSGSYGYASKPGQFHNTPMRRGWW